MWHVIRKLGEDNYRASKVFETRVEAEMEADKLHPSLQPRVAKVTAFKCPLNGEWIDLPLEVK